MMHLRKIVRGGQITLPKAFREKYHLNEGDLLETIEEDDRLILRPIKAVSRQNEAARLISFLNEIGDVTSMDEKKLLRLAHEERKRLRRKK